MTREEKLNTLTRLAPVIAIVMYYMEYKHWLVFLLIAVLFLITVQYASKAKECNETDVTGKKEHFSFPDTRVDYDNHPIVAPTFTEEHRIPSPSYDMHSVEFTNPVFEEPIRPQEYPYGHHMW